MTIEIINARSFKVEVSAHINFLPMQLHNDIYWGVAKMRVYHDGELKKIHQFIARFDKLNEYDIDPGTGSKINGRHLELYEKRSNGYERIQYDEYDEVSKNPDNFIIGDGFIEKINGYSHHVKDLDGNYLGVDYI